jgi:hypothetical protein
MICRAEIPEVKGLKGVCHVNLFQQIVIGNLIDKYSFNGIEISEDGSSQHKIAIQQRTGSHKVSHSADECDQCTCEYAR